MKRSKNYKKAVEGIDSTKTYTVAEALELAQKTSYSKFDGSIDVIINLLIPSKKKNESVRGSLTFPHQVGTKSIKIAVITNDNDIKTAEAAGADEVGSNDLIKKIEEGYTDFDILIASPDMMPQVAKLGRSLGPKGLMPNPKNETVTADLERVIKGYKAGKVDFKVNEQGAVKGRIGKVSQTAKELEENFKAFFSTVHADTRIFGPNRLKSVYVSATMGPSFKIDKSHLVE
ncbi:50S ribosomal protein L1 [Candidatus Dojkabacteria bacterium]|uniref:Ribosomal protein n=1 Tax=Candidatus Dojkabacteria bacterium TaxID=2099670 RepID=A0A955L7L9_9BACT|nr:50S ribosomal protein L1 [Candidatus Dojkabacteria bacterium]